MNITNVYDKRIATYSRATGVVDLFTERVEDSQSIDVVFSPIFNNQRSFNFDGVDEFIDHGDVFNFSTSDPFTFNTWVKPVAFTTQDALFSKTTLDANVFGYALYVLGSGELFIQMRTPTLGELRTYTFGTSVLSTGTWQMVTLTYDGSQDMDGFRVYINGVVGNTPPSQSLTGDWLQGQSFLMSARSTSFFYNGLQEEFSVWSTAFDLTDVLELYNSGVPESLLDHTEIANLDAWFRMGDALADDATGVTGNIQDVTGNGNNGVPQNTDSSNFVLDTP